MTPLHSGEVTRRAPASVQKLRIILFLTVTFKRKIKWQGWYKVCFTVSTFRIKRERRIRWLWKQELQCRPQAATHAPASAQNGGIFWTSSHKNIENLSIRGIYVYPEASTLNINTQVSESVRLCRRCWAALFCWHFKVNGKAEVRVLFYEHYSCL